MVKTPSHLHVQDIAYQDPVCAFTAFAQDDVTAFFDSADGGEERARYAYIAADPFRIITDHDGEKNNPFDTLQQELAKFPLTTHPDLPPFQTGAVGFLSYELGQHLERLPTPKPQGLKIPELMMGFYDTIAAFDVIQKHAWIIASDVADNRSPAPVRAQAMAKRIANAPKLQPINMTPIGVWQAEQSQKEYEALVTRAIDYIHRGDIFQVNLSQRFISPLPAELHPFTLYRRLRNLSPAPFSAYLSCGNGLTIASASPERYLHLTSDGQVETRPIKGTRPRGDTKKDDAQLAQQLLNSHKDHAENLMIVDLLRNDLSRVCKLGSVEASQIASLESFANVHHLVSVVRGKMRKGLRAIDLLKAAFPGGSVTGAPKIRAMEIINELEPARRGPYCGALGWLGFDGAMDTSVIIRTLTIKDDQVVAQAGGAIVADSDPKAEYNESLAKARALLDCLSAEVIGT